MVDYNFKKWIKISDCSDFINVENTICLTFDIDWAPDFVINHTIDLVEKHKKPATWFITHDTPLLDRLRKNKDFELGIHPNFNELLNRNSKKNIESILDDILEIVPEAKSIRSHSLTQNSRMMDIFKKKGLKFDCNNFIPYTSKIILKPFELWNGIIKVTHFWQDDVNLITENDYNVLEIINTKGINVFNFHPIHIYLNNENYKRYQDSKRFNNDPEKLNIFRNKGFGTQNILEQLLKFKNV